MRLRTVLGVGPAELLACPLHATTSPTSGIFAELMRWVPCAK
jgi:hypothetical protein